MGTEQQSGFRLSPRQERLWRLQAEGNVSFVAQCSLAIAGDLDNTRLQRALRGIVARHEIFRTGFRKRQGMSLPFQVIAETGDVCWQAEDLSTLAEEEQKTALMKMVQAERIGGFDLERGPALRALLIKLDEKKHELVLSIPALCADTASLRNIVRELQRPYDGSAAHDDAEIMQYADIVEWQNELLEADDTRIARDYWKERAAKLDLAGLLSSRLPFEKQNATSWSTANPVRIHLPAQVSTAIWMSGGKLGVSAADYLLTCW